MELKLSIFLFFFISTTILQPSTTTGHPLLPTSTETAYIRTSCATTRYPETCFTTLSKYATTINHDPSRLIMAAIHVALTTTIHTTTYISKLSHHNVSNNTGQSLAIQDCMSVLGDVVDDIKKSQKEMKRLGLTGESVRFQVSNVLTWMSAALTNEETCVDGFDDVEDGDWKVEVCGRVVVVREVTSNALGLVNSLLV